MSTYPFAIDDDNTIIRVDDNITEIGGDSINQLRAAVFAIEQELGVNPAGAESSLSNFLSVSFNDNGTIKASALTSVGLVTLPIVDNEVASNAGIKEYKLALDYSTSDLHTAILANSALLNSLITFTNAIFSDLHLHISGAHLLSDGSTSARHVLSHIDVNSTPFDSREPSFIWTGLLDKTGTKRTGTQLATVLQQINDDLVRHENSIFEAHNAEAISVDTSAFIEIPTSATSAQKVFDYLDEAEVLNMGTHRATQHSNGIPRRALAQSLIDGYGGPNVVQSTSVQTFLTHPPNTGAVDSLSVGDDVIKFIPDNTNFVFDAQFGQVQIGDIVRVNYANGIEIGFPVESIRFVPGSEWIVRINGTNLFDSTDGYARIDRSRFDTNTYGVFAVASANASTPSGPTSFSSVLSSVIVGHPKGATALGLGFDPGQLNATHYNLYLEFYPTGNPADRVISMPAIDVTGNAGVTPGSYDLETIVDTINNTFRRIGYNYRFIVFSTNGELGIMLADAINNASFAIVRGQNSSGTLLTGSFSNNVIGGNSVDDFDALGFGPLGSNIASPAYQTSWTDSTAALIPTKVIVPLKNRNCYVNGQRLNSFIPTYLAQGDGYWDGYISNRNPVGILTVETTYTINMDLAPSGLKPGKTIVVQPTVAFSDPLYNDVDYGRFIIKSVTFATPCGGTTGYTNITVINGIHGTGAGFGFSSIPPLPIHIYFSDDSVGFDSEELIDQSPTITPYARLHEIFINEKGHTFSHERARAPRQTENTTLLGTSNLHIKNVSPKLRGYQGSDPLVFSKFVRFYVLSYDTTSGSYDGYIGKISGASGIVFPGPVVTGRKNVTTRFYDETYLDYIDFTFEEESPYPGQSILSTAAPRYVDVELFSSLQLDDEFMTLATCEVNWQPASGQYIVQHVRDARDFGSVGETDFTTSALSFLSAGDRYLHENGVIRGLSLDFIGDNGEVFFNGGIALVNGKFATLNNMAVTIPQLYPQGSSLPQTVEWAICVNEHNDLVPILLTSSQTQYFATIDGVNSYYVQSATLSEIVNTRKDLIPIAIANVTINSITVNSIADIRRFITSEGLNISLTWTADQKTVGHFNTLSALQNWVNNYDAGANFVQLKGIFNITSSVDLRGFNKPVIFDGSCATININGPGTGFVLEATSESVGNITFRNFSFNYDPSDLFGTYTVNDYINTGHGCIYMNAGSSSPTNFISNIGIENCSFASTTAGTQRPPFINIELHSSGIINRLAIKGCSFSDVTTVSQAAVAIVKLHDLFGASPALVSNCIIKDNICSNQQGIYLTVVGTSAVSFSRHGIGAINTTIENNNCDVVGFLIGAGQSSVGPLDGYVNSTGLSILNNSCTMITTANSLGTSVALNLFAAINYGTGNVKIIGNSAKWIQIFARDHAVSGGDTTVETNSTIIANNILEAYDSNYIATRFAILTNENTNSAIAVNSSRSDTAQVNITGNHIKYGINPDGGTFTYHYGIYTAQSSIIADNDIVGIADSGTAIAFFATSNRTVPSLHSVKNNKITANGASPFTWIGFAAASNMSHTTTGGIISGNYLVDGYISGETLGAGFPYTWTIKDNIGQESSVLITGDMGFLGLAKTIINGAYIGPGNAPGSLAPTGTAFIAIGPDVSNNTFPDTYAIEFLMDTTSDNSYLWSIPLAPIVPYGAYITSISTTVQSSRTIANAFNIAIFQMNLQNAPNATNHSFDVNFGSVVSGTEINTVPYSAGTSINLMLTIPYGQCQMIPSTVNGRLPVLNFNLSTHDTGGSGTIIILPVSISYRW